jgi:hypothetical protein
MELPIPSILRFLAIALGPSDFLGGPTVGVPAVLETFAFCGLPLPCTDFLPVLEAPLESEPGPDEELELSDDDKCPDSESQSLSLGGLRVKRVWLEPAREQDPGTDEAVVPPTLTTAAFGVGASSPDSDSESLPSSDEGSELDGSVDMFVNERSKPKRMPTSGF